MNGSSLLPTVPTVSPVPTSAWGRGRTARLVAAIVLLAYSSVMFTFVPVAYIKIEPGSATDVHGLISVEGTPTYDARGRLLFLTVSLSRRLTPVEALSAWLDDEVELVKEKKLTGDLSREELTRVNLAVMRKSELTAVKLALEHLGYEVKVLGGLVIDVLPGRPAAEHVQAGDVVVAVDGKRVTFSEEAVKAVRARRPGDTVALTVERDGQERTFTVGTVEGEDGVAQVGISLTDNLEFPIDVDIDTGRVGGPSAGLAFTLAVIDELTDGELTGGEIVAVTGQIEPDGSVLPVGGVEQKTVAARRAGAVLMIVPHGEAEAARRLAGDMKVVAVDDLADALSALASVGGNALALPHPVPHPGATP